MLFVGLIVAALGAAMMTVATRQLSRVNEGHYLPVIVGKFAVRSPLPVTALRVGAQAMAVIAAWIVAGATWDYQAPWPSVFITIATFVAPVAIPVILITMAHSRRLATPS